mgnify:CR=1 FL=1
MKSKLESAYAKALTGTFKDNKSYKKNNEKKLNVKCTYI